MGPRVVLPRYARAKHTHRRIVVHPDQRSRPQYHNPTSCRLAGPYYIGATHKIDQVHWSARFLTPMTEAHYSGNRKLTKCARSRACPGSVFYCASRVNPTCGRETAPGFSCPRPAVTPRNCLLDKRFRSSIRFLFPNEIILPGGLYAPNEERLVLYGHRGLSGLGRRAVEAGEEPAGCFTRTRGVAGLRVLQGQGTAHLSCQARRPHAMRCLPYDQQRAVTP